MTSVEDLAMRVDRAIYTQSLKHNIKRATEHCLAHMGYTSQQIDDVTSMLSTKNNRGNYLRGKLPEGLVTPYCSTLHEVRSTLAYCLHSMSEHYSYPVISAAIGQKSHSSTIDAAKKYKQELKKRPDLEKLTERIFALQPPTTTSSSQ